MTLGGARQCFMIFMYLFGFDGVWGSGSGLDYRGDWGSVKAGRMVVMISA